MTTQVKPGMRCECRGTLWHEHTVASPEAYATGNHSQCPHEATRMVTVAAVTGGASRPEWQARGYGAKVQRHLCAPCAEYHEARQKESA